jgi:thiamine pyrophosphokinase
MINVRENQRTLKADDGDDNAAIFVGEQNSALVVGGHRWDVKRRTTVNRLDFNKGTSYRIPNRLIQDVKKISTT